jgi:hypothetical protein
MGRAASVVVGQACLQVRGDTGVITLWCGEAAKHIHNALGWWIHDASPVQTNRLRPFVEIWRSIAQSSPQLLPGGPHSMDPEVREGVCRILLQRCFEVSHCGVQILAGQLFQVAETSQVRVVRLRVDGTSASQARLFFGRQRERQRPGDAASDVALQRQNAGELAVEVIGPPLCSTRT